MTNQRSGKIEVNGIGIYYEVYGEGEPLLLIEGLGYASWMWFKQIPDYSKRYRVIIFDNRGVGNTDKPNIDYSIEMMADDAAGLLRALALESAHVLGVSMGGFIAQEMAIKYPHLVKSLILVSTSSSGREIMPGGRSSLLGSLVDIWELMPAMLQFGGKANRQAMDSFGIIPESKIRDGLSLAFTREYLDSHKDEIDRIVEWRLKNPEPFYAWKRQLIAGMRFDASQRVNRIKSPTLVVSGSQDRLVSPEISKRLAEKIPNSRMVKIEGAGHLSFIEKHDEFNQAVLAFLEEVTQDTGTDTRKSKTRNWWRRIVSSVLGRGH